MLNRLGVRFKILATLAVPVLVLIIAASVFANQALNEASQAQAAEAQVQGLNQLENLFNAFTEERNETMWQLENDSIGAESDDGSNAATLASLRTRTDQAFVSYQSFVNALDLGSYDATVARSLELSAEERSTWARFRNEIDAGLISPDRFQSEVVTFLNAHMADFDTVAATVPNRQLANYITASANAIDYNAQIKFDIDLVNRIVAAQVVGQPAPDATYDRIAVLIRDGGNKRNEFSASILALNNPDITLPVADQQYLSVRDLISSRGVRQVVGNVGDIWQEASRAELNQAGALAIQLRGTTIDLAVADSNSARNAANLTIWLVVAAVLASVAIALLIARSVTTPLRRLTVAAGEVRELLPQLVDQMAIPGEGPDLSLAQVPVTSSDEIGRLAEAFNQVNATTINVAQEQAALRGSIAEMFVNVARRDQVLLNRQLGFLDELERAEEDPSVLADLFRLDHLATRMRRNAESLLILAGIDTGRRIRQAMPISDVVRTASSEIEMYDRIQLDIQVDPLMLGHNALNAAHLIAELLENSTQFSEPNTMVEVTTTRGASVVQVFIRDYGLGMSAEDLEEANRKVARSEASEMLGAQRLGLYVVRRIADRLDARVALHPAPDGRGTVAVVEFPEILFADSSHDNQLPEAPPASFWNKPDAEASAPAPAIAQEAYQPQVQSAESEAPVVREVDIAALTDGSTEAGMPRRRAATPTTSAVSIAEPGPSRSSSGLPVRGGQSEVAEEDIVLPPLATPTLDVSSEPETFGWKPPQAAMLAGASLPARRRTGGQSTELPPIPDPVAEPAAGPVISGEERHSLFASFRPSNDLIEMSPEALGKDANAPESVQDHSKPRSSVQVPSLEDAGTTPLPSRGRHSAPVAPDSSPHGIPEVVAEEPPAPMVIPALEPDESYAPSPALSTSMEAAQGGYPQEQLYQEQSYQDPAFAQQGYAQQAYPVPQEQQHVAPQPDQTAYVQQQAAWQQAQPAYPVQHPAPVEQQAGALAFDPAAAAQAQLPQFNDLVSGGAQATASDRKQKPAKRSFADRFRKGRNEQLKRKMETMPRLTDLVVPTYLEPEPVDLPAPSEQGFIPLQPTGHALEPYAGAQVQEPAPTQAPQVAPQPQAYQEPAAQLPPQAPPMPPGQSAPLAYSAPEAPAQNVWPPAPPALPEQAEQAYPPPPTWQELQQPAAEAWAPQQQPQAQQWQPPQAPQEQPYQEQAWAGPTVPQANEQTWAPAVEPAAPVVPAEPPAWHSPEVHESAVGQPWSHAPVPEAPAPYVPEVQAPAQAFASQQQAPAFNAPGAPAGEWAMPVFDEEATARLAMASGIQEQALAELSQLSSYRPKKSSGGGGLAKRVPGAVPADSSAPTSAAAKISRDAAELRAKLSAFQSGTSRARENQDENKQSLHPTDSASATQ